MARGLAFDLEREQEKAKESERESEGTPHSPGSLPRLWARCTPTPRLLQGLAASSPQSNQDRKHSRSTAGCWKAGPQEAEGGRKFVLDLGPRLGVVVGGAGSEAR